MNIPKSEILWVQYVNNGKITFIVTSNQTREWYYLYELIDGRFRKTKYKAHNPMELEAHIH